jgi:hypothetical protein
MHGRLRALLSDAVLDRLEIGGAFECELVQGMPGRGVRAALVREASPDRSSAVLDAMHVLIAEPEVVSHLVHQHMPDNTRQIVAGSHQRSRIGRR